MRYNIFIIILLAILPSIVFSQKSRKWKKMRYELIYGIGGTGFLGELGGADKIGTHFVNDLEISMTRPLMFAGIRYRITEVISYKGGVYWGWLSGNDKKTEEETRQYRNLHFRSPIVEFNNQIEYSIIKEPRSHKYSIQKVPGMSGSSFLKTNTYLFTGINVFWFNPKAKYNNQWVALQPLGTEGQGIIESRKKYSRVSVSIPIGAGMKWIVDRQWCVGLEYGLRKTFTDYLDDVSKSYVDKSIFGDNTVAMALSDPSNGSNPGWTAAGEQRGDPRYTDSYMFVTIYVAYKLRTGKGGRPMF